MTVAGWLLVAAFTIELLLFTFLRNLFGPFISPVLLWLAGLGVGISGMWAFKGRSLPEILPPSKLRTAGLLLPAAVLLLLGVRVAKLLRRFPIDPAQSDIIPSIQVFVRRWLDGEWVYAPIHEFGYLLHPTYLPVTWLSFVPAELLNIDYRWMAFGGFCLSSLIGIGLVLRRRVPLLVQLAVLAVPLFLIQALLQTNPGTFANTVELLIVGYYLLLAYCIWRGSWWAQALGLTACLLSRFSLVFWVPLWILLLWHNAGKQVALRVAGLTALLVLVIYIVPFLSHDWGVFARAQFAYTEAAVAEWQQPTLKQPEHLYRGVGLAIFFHRFAPGSTAQQVQLIRLVHSSMCIGIAVGAIGYWFRWRPSLDYRVYALLTLKIYLVTFYAFVQVPYVYLTLVGVAFSWPLLLLLPADSRQTINAKPVVVTT
jgi:hypothetical protein